MRAGRDERGCVDLFRVQAVLDPARRVHVPRQGSRHELHLEAVAETRAVLLQPLVRQPARRLDPNGGTDQVSLPGKGVKGHIGAAFLEVLTRREKVVEVNPRVVLRERQEDRHFVQMPSDIRPLSDRADSSTGDGDQSTERLRGPGDVLGGEAGALAEAVERHHFARYVVEHPFEDRVDGSEGARERLGCGLGRVSVGGRIPRGTVRLRCHDGDVFERMGPLEHVREHLVRIASAPVDRDDDLFGGLEVAPNRHRSAQIPILPANPHRGSAAMEREPSALRRKLPALREQRLERVQRDVERAQRQSHARASKQVEHRRGQISLAGGIAQCVEVVGVLLPEGVEGVGQQERVQLGVGQIEASSEGVGERVVLTHLVVTEHLPGELRAANRIEPGLRMKRSFDQLQRRVEYQSRRPQHRFPLLRRDETGGQGANRVSERVEQARDRERLGHSSGETRVVEHRIGYDLIVAPGAFVCGARHPVDVRHLRARIGRGDGDEFEVVLEAKGFA